MQFRFGRLVLGICLSLQGVMSQGGVSAASTPAENLPLSQNMVLAPPVATGADQSVVPLSAGADDDKPSSLDDP